MMIAIKQDAVVDGRLRPRSLHLMANLTKQRYLPSTGAAIWRIERNTGVSLLCET